MKENHPRDCAARYYDLNPNVPDDIGFYVSRLPSERARVLELGCGTGRVTVPLVRHCAFIHGVDHSDAMLAIAAEKIQGLELGVDRIQVSRADIQAFDLDERFDLIIAPFRVIQTLLEDAELEGLFDQIRRHLSDRGRCILNAFHPSLDRDRMRTLWATNEERVSWEVPVPGGKVICLDSRSRIDPERLIIYPTLTYRRLRGVTVVEECSLPLAMRCYCPEEFVARIEGAGFTVTEKWGGYANEKYGEGKELVVEFGHPA